MKCSIPKVLFVTLVVIGGCTMSTPTRTFDDPEDGSVSDEPENAYDPCEILGYDGFARDEVVVQINTPECDSGICVHYYGHIFCTHRCRYDQQCDDVGDGICDIDFNLGDPEFHGPFCAPDGVGP